MQRLILNIAAALSVAWGGIAVYAQESGNAMFDRLSALEETASGSFRSDADFRTFADEIRRITEEIAADPEHPDAAARIRSLFAIAEERGMEELRPMIVAALGPLCCRVEVPGEPGPDGLIHLKIAAVNPATGRPYRAFEFHFADPGIRPLDFEPAAGLGLVWFGLNGNWRGQGEMFGVRRNPATGNRQRLFLVDEPEFLLWSRVWREFKMEPENFALLPGELVIRPGADGAPGWEVVFAPVASEARTLETRLRSLHGGGAVDLEESFRSVAAGIAALRERPEFGVLLPALVWETRTPAYDRLRPLLPEYFPDSYETISFPEEPDADGFFRVRRKFSREKGHSRVIVINLEFHDAKIRPLPAVFSLVSSGDGSSNMLIFFGLHPISFGGDAGWSVHDRWSWSPAEAAWIYEGGGGGYWRGDSSGNFVPLTPGGGKVEYRFLAFSDDRIDFEAVYRPLSAKEEHER